MGGNEWLPHTKVTIVYLTVSFLQFTADYGAQEWKWRLVSRILWCTLWLVTIGQPLRIMVGSRNNLLLSGAIYGNDGGVQCCNFVCQLNALFLYKCLTEV